MSEKANKSPAKPAVVLGLTFLVIGLAFALPFNLIPQGDNGFGSGLLSPEASNVYAVTAWAGWAHFIFAFRGQGSTLVRIQDSLKIGRLWAYLACLALTIFVLYWARSFLGAALFSGIVWVYFIDHFLKAEKAFEGAPTDSLRSLVTWVSSYQLLIAFIWLSAVLLNIGDINSQPWIVWIVSLLLGGGILAAGGWRSLSEGEFGGHLLSLFFIGEALVWGAYSRYGGPSFLAGVYVFHIAAGSFFHYFGSYFYAQSRVKAKDLLLASPAIVAVNAGVIGIGFIVANTNWMPWLTPVLGVQWFTLWVAVHLVLSDLFPAIKTWRRGPKEPQPAKT